MSDSRVELLEKFKRRYAAAWKEYSTNFDPKRKMKLEIEMDSAQSNFSDAEFQEFKVTLPGYVEYWEFLNAKAREDFTRAFDQVWQRGKQP